MQFGHIIKLNVVLANHSLNTDDLTDSSNIKEAIKNSAKKNESGDAAVVEEDNDDDYYEYEYPTFNYSYEESVTSVKETTTKKPKPKEEEKEEEEEDKVRVPLGDTLKKYIQSGYGGCHTGNEIAGRMGSLDNSAHLFISCLKSTISSVWGAMHGVVHQKGGPKRCMI